MKHGNKKAGLFLFALFDVMLIAGILLLIRYSGVYSGKNMSPADGRETGTGTVSAAPEEKESPESGPALAEEVVSTAGAAAESVAEPVSAAEGAEEPVSAAEDTESASEAEEMLGDLSEFFEEHRDGITEEELTELMTVLAERKAGSTAEEIPESADAAVSAPEEPVDPEDYSKLPPTKRCLVDGTFWEGCPERDIQLLTPNPYSRPQFALEEVHDIVIHYVGNPGTTAQQNRDYFESLKNGADSASSHFVVGLDGEIIQCISCSEWSYASNHRNFDTISIECCHPDAGGKFTDATYNSVVHLTAWLCKAFGCGPDHVIRHHDVTGKICPKYYVEHEDAWLQMKADIKSAYEELGD